VVEHYGRPSRTLLMGDSMGGAIVTLMAEAEQGQSPQEKKYHGVVAVGAALDDPTMPHPHRAADSPPLSRRFAFVHHRSSMRLTCNR
jgi:alpha-beta hydrolase superfamily lysophospholipase